MTLLADVNCPGPQEDLISNWEPAHSLVEDAVSGAKIAPHLLALAVTCLPFCLWWWDEPVCSQLALPWYSFSPLFCKRARLCLIAFCRKVLSLSLVFPSLASPHFGVLSHISSLRLSSGHSGLFLILSMQPMPPCSAPTHYWQTRASGLATSPLGVAVRRIICGFFFPLLIMLPSEIPKLPTDPQVKGFPGVWKLFRLHDSLPMHEVAKVLECQL